MESKSTNGESMLYDSERIQKTMDSQSTLMNSHSKLIYSHTMITTKQYFNPYHIMLKFVGCVT